MDGNTVVVGDPGAPYGMYFGAVYVYVQSGTTWSQQGVLTASDGANNNWLGGSVALEGDTAVAGAYVRANGRGAAYVFVRSWTAWTQQAERQSPAHWRGLCLPAQRDALNRAGKLGALDSSEFTTFFGQSVALDGDTALIGAFGGPGSGGAVHSYSYLPSPLPLTVNPSTGPPLTTLTVAGSGFSPNEVVNLTYSGAPQVPLGTATADGSGAFQTSLSLPLASYSNGFIRAAGVSGGMTGAANFSVTPRLVLNPAAVTPGDSVQAQGFGFAAGEIVNIYWKTPQLLLGSLTADSTGSFYQAGAFSIVIPQGSPAGVDVAVGQGRSTFAIVNA